MSTTLVARRPCGCVVGISVMNTHRKNVLATFAEWLAAGYELSTATREQAIEDFRATYECPHEKTDLKSESPLQLLASAIECAGDNDMRLEWIARTFKERLAEHEDEVDAERNDMDRPLLENLP